MGDPLLHVGTSGWSYPDWIGPFYPTGTLARDFLARYSRQFGAVEIRHRSWLCDGFYRLLEKHKTALVLADLYYMPKLDHTTTDFTYIRLLGKRSAIPDDFSRARLDREPELALWAGRIREYLARGLAVFAFANNRFQGHGPATARALLARVAGNGTDL